MPEPSLSQHCIDFDGQYALKHEGKQYCVLSHAIKELECPHLSDQTVHISKEGHYRLCNFRKECL